MAYLTLSELKSRGFKSLDDIEDEDLQKAIELYSGMVEEYCHTKFEPTQYQQRFDVMRKIRMAKTPLLTVLEVEYQETELIKDIDFYEDIELNMIELEDTSLYEKKRKSLTVDYLYGYDEVPAIVKKVIGDLINADVNIHTEVGNLASENWDGEYSYTKRNESLVDVQKDILGLLDDYIEGEYTPTTSNQVRARYF